MTRQLDTLIEPQLRFNINIILIDFIPYKAGISNTEYNNVSIPYSLFLILLIEKRFLFPILYIILSLQDGGRLSCDNLR